MNKFSHKLAMALVALSLGGTAFGASAQDSASETCAPAEQHQATQVSSHGASSSAFGGYSAANSGA